MADESLSRYLADLDALEGGDKGETQGTPATPAPMAGESEGASTTAQELDKQGFFTELRTGADQAKAKTIEDNVASSQKSLYDQFSETASKTWSHVSSPDTWKSAGEAVTDPKWWAEMPKGIVPGAVRTTGTGIQGLSGIPTAAQIQVAKFNYDQLATLDKIEAGEKVSDANDPYGFQHMTPEQRFEARRDIMSAQQNLNITPVQERLTYHVGEMVKEWSKGLLPAAPGYEQSVSRQIGEAGGSMAAGIPISIVGGPLVGGAFFALGGAGEAIENAVEFDKKERAAGRPGLRQEQIAMAGVAGIGPGATDILPIEHLLRAAKMPVPPGFLPALSRFVGRVGGQVLVEGIQEGGQQFLQNVIAKQIYDENKNLFDEVPGNVAIGGAVGGMAQTGTDAAQAVVHRIAGRRAHAGKSSTPAAPVTADPPEQPVTPGVIQTPFGVIAAPPPPTVVPSEPSDVQAPVTPIPQFTPPAMQPDAPMPAAAPAAPAAAAPQAPALQAQTEAPGDPNAILEQLKASLGQISPEMGQALESVMAAAPQEPESVTPAPATLSEEQAPQNDNAPQGGLQLAGMAMPTADEIKSAPLQDLLGKLNKGDLGQVAKSVSAMPKATKGEQIKSLMQRLTQASLDGYRGVTAKTNAFGDGKPVDANVAKASGMSSRAAMEQRIRDAIAGLPQGKTVTARPKRDVSAKFNEIIAGSTPRSQWGKALKVDDATLQSMIDDAVGKGLLRLDRNGRVARTATSKYAVARTKGVTDRNALSIPADQRIQRAIELRGNKASDFVRKAALALEEARGTPQFKRVFNKIAKDKALGKREALELAHLVGYPPTAKTGKAEALASIQDRHLAQQEFVNAQSGDVREGAGSVPEGSVPGSVQADEGVGRSAEAPGGDRAGSGRPVVDAAGSDGQQPGSAGIVPGSGESPAGGARDDTRDGQRGPDTRAPVKPYQPSAEDLERISKDAAKKAAELDKAREERAASNYRITPDDMVGKGGPKAKVRANLEALRVLRTMEEEGRTSASPAEKQKLVKYVGWGAFAQDLFASYKTEWAKERAELQNLLTPEEYASAQRSTTNAHYTSPDVIKGMWSALEHMGFKGGRVLEPSAGIGHFIGLQPENLARDSDWTAVELDTVSGRITKALYGAADVRIGGFEEQKWPHDHFDLAISNVPFGDYKVHDAEYNKHNLLIHDYFFVKSMDLVRPGGIVAFITSSGTLDKVRDSARREIEKRGTFLGAIRLPGGSQGAFKANAGTDVTTDIIFVRKRIEGEPANVNPEWQTLTEIKTPEGPTSINGYFAAHPEMMLGKMRLTGTMYRDNSPVLIGPSTDLDAKVAEAAKAGLPADAMTERYAGRPDTVAAEDAVDTTVGERVKEGAFYEKDGKLFRKVVGVGEPAKLTKQDEARVRAFLPMRDIVSRMLAKQAVGSSEGMDELRMDLNANYDAFVEEFGPINLTFTTEQKRKDGKVITIKRMPNLRAFDEDPDAYAVAAIEVYDEKTNTARKAAIFTEDIVAPYVRPEISGPADALAVSLNETGGVDIERIAGMLKTSPEGAVEALGDAIYLNPRGERHETAARYLSGDVVKKLEEARVAAGLSGGAAFERNVKALEAVQPKPLSRAEITAPFGASWVPTDVINQFLTDHVGARGMKVDLNPTTKQWRVVSQGGYSQTAQAQWGTDRKAVAEIVEAALNSTPIQVFDKQSDGSRVRNNSEETKARAKVELLREAFTGQILPGAPAAIGGWVWQEEQRAQELEALYNASFNRIVKEEFDGKHLTFPGLAQVVSFPDGTTGQINLTPARTSAIWRIIQNGNTLIDHVVGAGKTWTSIMAVMEMKRLGQIRRPMFVVPNHMLHQFSAEFLQAYPGAKLLVATKDSMSAAKRREFAAKAAAEKWDGIIITHSAFGRLRMNETAYKDYYQEAIDQLETAKTRAAREGGKNDPTIKDLEKAKRRLEAKLQKLTNKETKDYGVTFEELGVDHITVDEAHLFKNLWFPTRHTRVKGISNASESQRATDLYIKIRHLEKSRPGRSTLFLTGTPLSNTMAEVYTMMRYLQHDVLDEYGIGEFDSWAQTFGEIKTKSELAPNGREFRDSSSFGSFVNIPELSTLYGKIADTQTAESLKLPRPKLKGGKPTIVETEMSDAEDDFLGNLIKEMENLKGKRPEPGAPNFLSLFTQGLQVGTDMRLIDPKAPRNPDGKIAKTIDNVHRIWEDGNANPQGPAQTQLIFLDMGVPGSKAPAKALSATAKPASVEEWQRAMDGDTQAKIEEIRKKLAEEQDEDAAPAEIQDEDDAVAEVMLQGKFNLYEDIKQGLIAKGVPANQIAFIHDAKNDDAKAKLFQAVREGKVRVLIGSSSKMGVGTNVQKRLVALHHVDAPWKPADVEQRDGRILRQGNMNPEVQIYRYVTKRSFDSYRWQILENKSHFIGQFRAGARGVRIAEDIDAPLPEAAELKAAATGDPRIVEHAELSRQLRVLEAQNAAHAGASVRARQMLGSTKSQIQSARSYLPTYEADVAKVQDLKGENFKVDLDLFGKQKNFVERKAAGELLKQSLMVMAEQAGYYGAKKSDLGTLSGFTMKALIRKTPNGIEVMPSIEGAQEYPATNQFILNEETPPAGLVMRWERLLQEVPRLADGLKSQIASLEAEIPKLEKASVSTPFGKQAELEDVRQRLAVLTEALDPAKMAEKRRRADAELEEDYVAQAMRNLKATSRTASGVVDTSASAGKAAQMAEGLTGEGAAKAATENFDRVIRDIFRKRETLSQMEPNALADEIDRIAMGINDGILKEGALYRTDDSDKYGYTAASEIPEARDQFAAEFWERLNDPSADPVETAAWVEWRMNLTDHIYADGVGKTSKAVAYIPLMRAGVPLPNYGPDKKAMFKYASDKRYDPNEGGESYLDDKWAKFLAYYRTLIPMGEGSPEAQRRDTAAKAATNKRELTLEEMEEIGRQAFESQKYLEAVKAAEGQTETLPKEFQTKEGRDDDAFEAWLDARTYSVNGKEVSGFVNIIDETKKQAASYLLKATGEAPLNERKAVVLLGLPGSGKSTISSGFAAQTKAAVLNGDDIKEFIPEFRNGLGSIAVHEEASEINRIATLDFMQEGTNLVLEKTGSNTGSIKKVISELRAHDYSVQLVLVDVPKPLAMYQIVQRFEKKGRIVPPAYVHSLKTNDVYYTLEAERAADGFTQVERKTPEGAWVFRTLAEPFQNRDIEGAIERSSQGLARVVRNGGSARGSERGPDVRAPEGAPSSGPDAGSTGTEVRLGRDELASPAFAPISDDELRALLEKELADDAAGTAEPGRTDDSGDAAGAEGRDNAAGPGADEAPAGGRAASVAGQPGPVRNAVVDRLFDAYLKPEALAQRAQAQGFTTQGWHATMAQAIAVPDPFRFGRDLGFHFAIGTPAAANERLGYPGDGVAFSWDSPAKKVAAKLGLYKPAPPPSAAKGMDNVLPLRVRVKNPLRAPDINRWNSPARWLIALNKPAYAKEFASPAIVRELRNFVQGWRNENRDTYKASVYGKEVDDFMYQDFGIALTSKLAEMGYDGIIYRNASEAVGSDSMMVWDPAQVRSAHDAFDARAESETGLLASKKHIDADILAYIQDLKAQDARGLEMAAFSSGYSPRFMSSLPQISEQIAAEARRMLPANIATKIVDRLTLAGRPARGAYLSDKAIVMISTAEGPRVAMKTLMHETAGHVLRDLYTKQEWQILLERADKVGIDQQLQNLLQGYRDFYARQGRSLKGLSGKALRDFVDGKIEEEKVAFLAEQYIEGARFGAGIDGLLKRIADFIEAIRNAFRGLGFQTADDIFAKVESGEIAQRPTPQDVAQAAETIFAPEMPTPRSLTLSPAGQALREAMLAIDAWHGSRHEIDQFSLEKVGIGEGAQAFGWGLYFAEAEGVAKHYKTAGLKSLPRIHINTKVIVKKHGGDVDAAWRDVVEQMRGQPKYHFESYNKDNGRSRYFATEQEAMDDAETQLEKMLSPKMVSGNMFGKRYWRKRDINSYKDWKVRREVSDNTVKFIGTTPKSKYSQRVDVVLGGIARSTRPEWSALDKVKQELENWGDYYHGGIEGNLYQVKLNVEKEELLDWFKPLKDQDEQLEMKLRSFIAANKSREVRMRGWRRASVPADDRARVAQVLDEQRYTLDDKTGADLYLTIAKALEKEPSSWVRYNSSETQKAASELLRSIGIKGIRFNDQMSRGGSPKYLLDGQQSWPRGFTAKVMDNVEVALLNSGGDMDAAATWLEAQSVSDLPYDATKREHYKAGAEFIRAGRVTVSERKQTQNIVIFDDTDVDITHKNGEPIKKEDVAEAMADIADDNQAMAASFARPETRPFNLPGFEGEVATDVADDGGLVQTITVGTTEAPQASVVLTQTPEGAWEASGYHLAEGADKLLLAQILDMAALELGRPLSPTGLLTPNQAMIYMQINPQALVMHQPVGPAAEGVMASPQVMAMQAAVKEDAGMVMAAFSAPTQTPPPAGTATPPAGQAPASDTNPRALDDIITELKYALNMPVTQGLGSIRVRDRTNNRSWFFRPKGNLRGQYQSNMGIARIKTASDIEAIAHEGGHHMERLLGAKLSGLLQQHSGELAAYGASVRTNATALSEGFAEWFSDYITNPAKAETTAPQFHQAFEDLVDAEKPGLLQNLDMVQLVTMSQAYQQYLQSDEMNQMLADLASNAPVGTLQKIGNAVRYVRDQASQIGYRKAIQQSFLEEIGNEGTLSGMASQIYTGAVDEGHPLYRLTRRFLEVADENQRVDRDNRAISLAVHENPYKLMRSVGDAFKTGLRWMQDGMPNHRHMDAGHRSASIHDALSMAMGPKWNDKTLALFNGYLVSRRAVEEWKNWEGKQARMAQLSATIDPLTTQVRKARAALNFNTSLDLAQQQAIRDAIKAADAVLAPLRVQLKDLSENGIQRAPTRHSRQAHERYIARVEAANPSFQDAAKMVYDFVWQSAVHDFRAGRLSQAELDYRATRKHYYVPFARSIPELEQAGVMAEGRGMGGRKPKFSKDKAFTGSQRAIYNPIETIIDQTFHRAAATHLNDAIKAYVSLAERAGPGASSLGERVVQDHLIDANNQAFRNLEQSLMALGHSANDAKELVRRIESDFGDTQLLLQFDTTAVGPAKPLNITFWENGERKYFRINDPELAQSIHNAVNGMGRELSNLFIDALAAPAALLRWGVTTNPTFILRNIIRDAMTAWLITGSIADPRTWPVVTQARGLYHELFQTDMARLYQEVGGLMGGQNVAALSKVRDKVDVMALKDRGLQLHLPKMGIAGLIGGTVGFAALGPAGAAFGAMLGIGVHKGPKKFIETISHFSDMSETATRLGVFTQAYQAALAYNPSLTPYQAAQEAAFAARDLIDFGKHGSAMLTAARLTPFMNANIQGLDKTVRALLGRSDRGNQVSTPKLLGIMAAGALGGAAAVGTAGGAVAAFAAPMVATALASRVAAARALISPFFKETHGLELSADDRAALGTSAKVWANLMLLTLGGVALAATYGGAGGDGEDEYKLIRDKFKYKAMPVKDPVSGNWYAIPKPFEWALPMNIIEAGIEAQYHNDKRFWEKVRENIVDVTVPPMSPQLVRLYSDIRGNYNSLSKRPIVPDYLKTLPPEERFNAYASEFAIWLSRNVNRNEKAKSAVEGVGSFVFGNKFELTPAIVDYAISQSAGYWGKDAQKATNLAFKAARGEDPRSEKMTELPLIGTMVQSFKIDPYRIAETTDAFYEAAGRDGGDYAKAAAGYRENIKRYGPQTANAYLANLPEDQRAYALLEASAPGAIRDMHPLNRLKNVVRHTGDIEREIIMGRLANTTNPANVARITLSPAKADEVRDLMARVKTIEIQNTLVGLGVKQFAGGKPIDIEPTMRVLEASAPEVYRELKLREQRSRVRDLPTSLADWTERKAQLLTKWQEAVDENKAIQRAPNRRTKATVPYEAMPGTTGRSSP